MHEITSRKTVVLAEPMGLVREGIAELCEATGRFDVVGQCSDGGSALDMVLALRPDIAIIDFNVSRLFSLELVRKLREQDCHTTVVVLASRSDRKLVLECLRSGVNAIVLKSGPARNLLDALDQVAAGGIYVTPELQIDKIFTVRKTEAADPLQTLSSREYQVFSLLIDGIRAKEIAARLDLSPKTVDTYRASLMRKLDIYDVAGLVKFAIQRELTSVA